MHDGFSIVKFRISFGYFNLSFVVVLVHTRILLGVGGPIDGFWNLYQQHKTDAVLEILMQYKIGKLDPKDVEVIDESDPYVQPPRSGHGIIY